MEFKDTLCSTFASITFVILAMISIPHYERIDLYAILNIIGRTVPATVVMGLLGRMMGAILDQPKNLTDADYRTDVLKALKRLDKNMTMADLTEKLKPVEDIPDINLDFTGLEEGGKDEPSA